MAAPKKQATSKTTGSAGGRASKEAVDKRRVARQLNAELSGRSTSAVSSDGRTEKRRQRLLRELKASENGKALTPIDFLAKIAELLDIGETLASIKKQGIKQRKVPQKDGIQELVTEAQRLYKFHPDAWRMLGISVAGSTRRGRPKKVV